MKYHQVLPQDMNRFHLDVSPGIPGNPKRYHHVSPGITRYHQLPSGITGCYHVSPGIIKYPQVVSPVGITMYPQEYQVFLPEMT